MATVTVRDLDDKVRDQLRQRAAVNGHSMEAEIRSILRRAVAKPPTSGLGSRVISRFAEIGGVDIGEIERNELPSALDLQ